MTKKQRLPFQKDSSSLLLSRKSVTQSNADKRWFFFLWNSLGISAPTDGMRDREGEWEKQLLVRAKKQSFTLYLVFSSLRRCVALGAKGHLRWERKREIGEREREGVILAAGLQNICLGLGQFFPRTAATDRQKKERLSSVYRVGLQRRFKYGFVVQTECLSIVCV